MGWTTTFDASHKVSGGGHVEEFVRHIARDVDMRDGIARGHSNANIDLSRTLHNVTFVNDGTGGVKPLKTDSGQLVEYLQARLAVVKKPLRKDAVLVRGLVLQLDPKWFDQHCSDWKEHGLNDEARHLTWAMLEWAAREFGRANIVGGSIHLDEASPQLQVIMTPVTDDGRLSQKDFFKGPADLTRQHKTLRQHMISAGYDADLSVSTRSRQRMGSAEFGAAADRARKARDEAEALCAQSRAKMAEASRLRAEAERDDKELTDRWDQYHADANALAQDKAAASQLIRDTVRLRDVAARDRQETAQDRQTAITTLQDASERLQRAERLLKSAEAFNDIPRAAAGKSNDRAFIEHWDALAAKNGHQAGQFIAKADEYGRKRDKTRADLARLRQEIADEHQATASPGWGINR